MDKPERKIAILGTAPNSRMFAPFDDNEWEIWVCSPGNRRTFSRVTRWYELHGIVDMKGPENADWNKDYFDWLNTQSFPVYMQEPNDLCPQARVFPMRAWLKHFGRFGRINATSSISWMIGHAIMEGATMIGVWGVDMADTSEAYTNQKSGCLNMLDYAERNGIQVTIPLESCLGTMPPLYGYAEASRMGRRLTVRKMSLQNEVENAQKQMNHWERQLYQYRGMLEDLEYIMRTFVDGEHDSSIAVEETEVEVGGRKGVVVHAKGTEVYTTAAGNGSQTASGNGSQSVVRIPTDIGMLDPDKFEKRADGLFVMKDSYGSGGNGGEHRAEE